jgi:hypothetical protein
MKIANGQYTLKKTAKKPLKSNDLSKTQSTCYLLSKDHFSSYINFYWDQIASSG